MKYEYINSEAKKYMYNGKELSPIVEIYHDCVAHLSGTTLRDFFLDFDKIVEAWNVANGEMNRRFKGQLPNRPVMGTPLSYGHLICLGAEVTFPVDGEPNIHPFAQDIDSAIEILKRQKGMDFTQNKWFGHYLEMNAKLNAAFPDKVSVMSGFSHQGPLTSATLMRGQDFFCDLLDEPEKCAEFLELMTDSIVEYKKCVAKLNGEPVISEDMGYLADDFASLVSPYLWEDFVVPYWNRYYEGTTTSSQRFIHCENLLPLHLKYLKSAGITFFQPSVSDSLTISNVKENTDIEFDWLLYAYHITEMSDQEIQQWVDNVVKAGITTIRTQIGTYGLVNNKDDRILAFLDAFDKYAVN